MTSRNLRYSRIKYEHVHAFSKWLEKVKLTNQQAHRFMKVRQEYERSNLTTSLNLGTNAYTYTHLGINAMELITTLPEPERTKEHKKASRYYK